MDAPAAGDIALFKFGRCVSHGAIITEWPAVIHSYIREGCIFGSADQGQLESRLVGIYRLRGVVQ
jgi:hypothetical protein